jgi:beta-mannosidase
MATAHPSRTAVDLGGTWRAAAADEELRRRFPEPDLDDRSWTSVAVPGQWRSSEAFAAHDGPVLHRRRFDGAAPGDGERSWLELDGVFYQGDVWLDGAYLGDTEGYFAPHAFEITERLRERDEHLLAIEVACTRPADRRAKRNLTGVFEHWDCIDPDWNPGGIWAPVRVRPTGPVRITSLLVTCRDANHARASLHVEAELDALAAGTVAVTTTVTDPEGREVAARVTEESLAAGTNRVRWSVTVEDPQLWWPHALGPQALHHVTVGVAAGREESDRRDVTTGLRQVRMRNLVLSVNGERLFLKGANCGPTRRALADATPEALVADVHHARRAGLDLLRVHAHITRPELYRAADEAGVLIWQDMPLQWGYARVRRQAARQARQAVQLLGHHPSVAVWCGHNEPLTVDPTPGAEPSKADRTRFLTGQALPSFNRTALDRSVRRSLERTDGSRPVIAHSGVLPHPVGGTDSHLYFGWYHGEERDLPRALARFPVLARFVSEFGAQAVPDTAAWMEPGRWPDLDWETLGAHHALQRTLLDRHVPREGLSFDEWRDRTQAYQATVVRHHVETLRRLKYRPTGGFCVFLLADAQPAVSWSLLDHERRPKAAYHALAAACAPVVVVADRPAAVYRPGREVDLAVHVVNDHRADLDATATAQLRWPGGGRSWQWEGHARADSVTKIGRVRATIPADCPPGPLRVELRIRYRRDQGAVGEATNAYDAEVAP